MGMRWTPIKNLTLRKPQRCLGRERCAGDREEWRHLLRKARTQRGSSATHGWIRRAKDSAKHNQHKIQLLLIYLLEYNVLSFISDTSNNIHT